AIAGRVFDATGRPVPQARIYGVAKPWPRETPFAFAETYGPRNAPSPMYGEHFAISDVPAGTRRLRVRIGERWVERVVTVAAGQLSWVEFRP
ncbi:MAG: carboxypeptidase-like regulatory domain-containing protein, partial [Thermoanaerobaculia bacterium]|nr:carboxypeptidase-like regulatory domain-containing protein [Thermoanaerobaculia bacterium]